MIDKLVLHIPFKEDAVVEYNAGGFFVPLLDVPVPLMSSNVEYDDNEGWKVTELRTCFESLASSHSGMAFKVYDTGMGVNSFPFVMIKCSPAKLLQGHNLYGSDDLRQASLNMTLLLNEFYPALCDMLDFIYTEVSEFDITYSSFIENPQTKRLFLGFLGNVSKGQTKSRGDKYQTTVYFGSKNSRIKKLKVYSKFEEMQHDVKSMLAKGFTDSSVLIDELSKTDFGRNAIRWEATIKKRWLERRAIPTRLIQLLDFIDESNNDGYNFYKDLWSRAWEDIFASLSGHEIIKMNDDNILNKLKAMYWTETASGAIRYTKAMNLFNFYMMLKTQGWDEIKFMMLHSKSTFNRKVSNLMKIGLSRAYLQNLCSSSGAEIIPLPRLIMVDFSLQLPDDFEVANDLDFVA